MLKFALFFTFWNYLSAYINLILTMVFHYLTQAIIWSSILFFLFFEIICVLILILTMLCSLFDTGHHLILKFITFFTFWYYLCPYFNLIFTVFCSLFDTGHYMILKYALFFTFWNYLSAYFNLILTMLFHYLTQAIIWSLNLLFSLFFEIIWVLNLI